MFISHFVYSPKTTSSQIVGFSNSKWLLPEFQFLEAPSVFILARVFILEEKCVLDCGEKSKFAMSSLRDVLFQLSSSKKLLLP